MHEVLLKSCSINNSESKHSIVHETLSQNYSMDISEYTTTQPKYKVYKESLVTKKVTSYFNIFKFGGNILDRLDVMYE